MRRAIVAVLLVAAGCGAESTGSVSEGQTADADASTETVEDVARGPVDDCAGEADGQECRVGDACDNLGACAAGACVTDAVCECASDADCAGPTDLCTGVRRCAQTAEGAVCLTDADTAVVCDPSDDPCVENRCDPATGACELRSLEGEPCDDGDACTTGEGCEAGACGNGQPVECDDDNICNGAETCDSVAGCVAGEALACGDDDACNGTETCDAALGCVAGTPPVCDDGNVCNGAETCDSAAGCVAGEALACGDDDACNGTEVCDATLGCVAGTPPVCDDGNVCNGGETCDAADGCVAGAPLACDDDDACNGTETCDATLGCVAGLALSCDDGDACNGTETCAPAEGCVAGEAPACDDDDACNGVEACDARSGCVAGEAPACDDGNECTDDSCDPAVGCVNAPVADDTPCGDGWAWFCASGTCEDLEAPCAGDIASAPDWFAESASTPLAGSFQFGQTHVVDAAETRHAPPVLEGRETIVLFTPDLPLDESTDIRIAAFEGDTLLGTLRATPPSGLPDSLEELYTQATLAPYSTAAWSGFLPWSWVREGVRVTVGFASAGVRYEASHTFTGLGAPHILTVSRAKIILFGEAAQDVGDLLDPTKLAEDLYGAIPTAELHVVEATPWIPDYVVVGSPTGQRRVSSVQEYADATAGADRWQILKNQFTLRMSAANTGRGLWRTGGGTDGSPYSFGTTVGLGWVRNDDGSYSDVNNSPYAAGWTGWSSLWLGECGNVTIHELGHSFTMAHFTGGTAAAWGIADEYPQDGTNLETHPWGFDTTRRLFRTWYRVHNADVPTNADGTFVGKRDPMNGGEGANAITCFPQYTGFHAEKAQAWSQNSHTIREVDGVPGVYRWNAATHQYDAAPPQDEGQAPIAVGARTVTLLGTLAATLEGTQVYPPIYWASGNVFELPDPEDPALPGVYDGGQYFLEITYPDGSARRALIAQGEVLDAGLGLFGVNLALDDAPERVDLYLSPTPYPTLDVAGATLMHTRDIGPPWMALPEVVRVGREHVANGPVRLTKVCTPDIDCDGRTASSTWVLGQQSLIFGVGDTPPARRFCEAPGGFTSIVVPTLRDDTTPVDVIVHAQRVIHGGMGEEVAGALDDATLWVSSPDATHELRVWIPFEENAGLEAGRYVATGDTRIHGWRGDARVSSTPIVIDLQVRTLMDADLTGGYDTPTLPNEPASSSYFVVEDPSMGAAAGEWWWGQQFIYAPVIDLETGELHTLKIRAWKVACGDWWEYNAGQANWDCDYYAHLMPEVAGNEWLVPGRTYQSPGSSPLVLIGKRWHQPNAGLVTGVFALRLSFTAP